MARTWAALAALLFLLIDLVEGRAYDTVSVEAGHEAVLSCPYISKLSLLMVTWKMRCSTCCLLAYRSDHCKTKKLHCSERTMWKYSPHSDPALCIYPVNLGDEGNYTCEVVRSAEAVFFFSRTVTVPPTPVTREGELSVKHLLESQLLTISWIPASSHSTEEEAHHPSGTVTRVSYISWVNSTLPTVTCLVTHPAATQTLSLELSHQELQVHTIMCENRRGQASCLIREYLSELRSKK